MSSPELRLLVRSLKALAREPSNRREHEVAVALAVEHRVMEASPSVPPLGDRRLHRTRPTVSPPCDQDGSASAGRRAHASGTERPRTRSEPRDLSHVRRSRRLLSDGDPLRDADWFPNQAASGWKPVGDPMSRLSDSIADLLNGDLDRVAAGCRS